MFSMDDPLTALGFVCFLGELEVPYEIKKYPRGADGLAPEELKKVNPLGLAPAITDGDLNIAESGAIVGESMSPVSWLLALVRGIDSGCERCLRLGCMGIQTGCR